MSEVTSEFRGISIPVDQKKKKVRSSTFILLAFICYQFLLCFLNTNVLPVTNPMVAGTEGLLLAYVVWKVLPITKFNELTIALGILVYFVGVTAIRGEGDPNGPRNVFIMLLSYVLGRSQPNRVVANRTVWIISIIVIIGAFIEFFFTDLYLHYFNILHYYMARGLVSDSVQHWLKQDSFVSGIRPGGRNILPILGDQRISSVFLEPVSMGNYAIVLSVWALTFEKAEKKEGILHFLVAVFCVIASDSRFASILMGGLVVLRFMPVTQKRGILLSLPLLTVIFLIFMSYWKPDEIGQDNVPGRLAGSGLALRDMEFSQIIGYGLPDNLADMGVAWSIEHFGVFLCCALYFILISPKIKDPQASRFRLMTIVYGLGILSVSGSSFYSAKTSALAWFLYGVLRGKETEEDALASDKNRVPLMTVRPSVG